MTQAKPYLTYNLYLLLHFQSGGYRVSLLPSYRSIVDSAGGSGPMTVIYGTIKLPYSAVQ